MTQFEQLQTWLVNYNFRHSLNGNSYLRFYDDGAIALWSEENELISYFEESKIDEIRDFLLTN